MTKVTKEIADHLHFQANHLYEQAAEFPEYKARNEAAAKEVEELETLFRNDDLDNALVTEVSGMEEMYLDGASAAYEKYRALIEDVGFNSHYETAEDFIQAIITEVKGALIG
ncbi:hypothetical protein GOB14_10025 [Sinorhizobium meliloti]|nr:hypothetical protein [Sinorhizobium meliloti]